MMRTFLAEPARSTLCRVLSVTAAISLLAGAAHAESLFHKSQFAINFLGVNVGEMKHIVELNNNDYKIFGSAKANSVVSVIAKVKANFSSTGKITNNRLVPATHDVKFKNGKKSGRLKLGFTPNGVQEIKAKPKIRYKKGTVPLEKSHLRNVLDPVSSLLFPVKQSEIGNGRQVCNRTLPIFDGRERMNLALYYKSKGSAKIKGFRGDTFTCGVRYQPISGIRPHKKNIKFMKANRDMQVTVARMGNSNFYTLIGFRVRTVKGMASGAAVEFSTR